MTNFTANRKSNKMINPEKAVLIIPILISLIICTFGSLFILRPLLNRSYKINEEIDIYLKKKDNLATQKKKLDLLNDKLKKAEEQKQIIIKLIGGTKDLGTLIAKINSLTNKSSVIVTGLEPKIINKLKAPINSDLGNNQIANSIQNQPLGSSVNNSSSGIPVANAPLDNNKNSNNSDPLLIPELEQHIISLSLDGPFEEILNFIRNLELLENIILTSNIEFKKINENNKKSKNNFVRESIVNTKFSTTISAYGRI